MIIELINVSWTACIYIKFCKLSLPLSLSLHQDLGAACGTKRPTCMLMVNKDDSFKEAYEECYEELKSLPLPI